MFVVVRDELDLASWDAGCTCLILQSHCTWLEFMFVLSYSELPVFVHSCASVVYRCAVRIGFHLGVRSTMVHVEEMVVE